MEILGRQKDGFSINPENRKYFDNKEKYIAEYRDEVSDKLVSYYALENRIKPNSRIIEMFENKFLRYQEFSEVVSAILVIRWFCSMMKENTITLLLQKMRSVEECESSMDLGATVRIPIKIFLRLGCHEYVSSLEYI